MKTRPNERAFPACRARSRTRGWLAALALAMVMVLLAAAGAVRAAVEPPTDPERVLVTGRDDARLEPFDRMMRAYLVRHRIPGASIAVTRQGRLVYARGFGYANLDKAAPVQPDALFRIASLSKPVTSAAIMALVDRGKIALEDRARDRLPPALKQIAPADPRWDAITIRMLLQHRGGFDRDKSFDPMFRSLSIAHALGTTPPAGPRDVIRWMLGRPLDFEPGSRENYSNFGYCVLGRVIEHVTGDPYGAAVHRLVLDPLQITTRQMTLGHTLPARRAPGEVHYYSKGTGRSVFPPDTGNQVPWPYGGWNLEAMDAHGGWVASAPALARFASAFDRPDTSPILSPRSIATLFERPPGAAGNRPDGQPRRSYYACGWNIVEVGPGQINTWHTGSLDGTTTLLVRRHDGLNWAILLNTRDTPASVSLINDLDPRVHRAADAVRAWPNDDLAPSRPR